MAEFNQVKITRILNPTSIDLGEYVINPFMGCEYACLYCYVRSNRVISRRNKPWGEFVDVRINSPGLLEKELRLKKPKTVLLGSTTECFQPAERQYRLTRKLLGILNKYKVYYVILSRSPAILDCLDLLKQGYCKRIYFTVNRFNSGFKLRLEQASPSFELRDETVNSLLEHNLEVIPYFSPFLPWVSDLKGVFERFPKAGSIEFECLNMRLSNINDIMAAIAEVEPALKSGYDKLLSDRGFYSRFWGGIEKDIANQAKSAKKKYSIYVHGFGDYFKNEYLK